MAESLGDEKGQSLYISALHAAWRLCPSAQSRRNLWRARVLTGRLLCWAIGS